MASRAKNIEAIAVCYENKVTSIYQSKMKILFQVNFTILGQILIEVIYKLWNKKYLIGTGEVEKYLVNKVKTFTKTWTLN